MKKLVVGVALFTVSVSVMAGDFMNADQIKAAFAGKTLIWEHMIKSKSGKSFYAEDGKVIGVANGKHREGTWSFNGDDLCVSYGKCLAIESDGKGGYYKVKNGTKRVLHITAVEDGNTVK